MKKRLILLLTIMFASKSGISQDILGAYIRIKAIPCNCTLPIYNDSIIVTMLADAAEAIVRPAIFIKYGNGVTGTLTLSNSSLANGIKINTYSGTYLYPGVGIYPLLYVDTFRVAGIRNFSDSQTLQINVKETIDIETWSSVNGSPKLSHFPVSYSVSGNQVLYDPGCVDPDGDSLSYELTNCLPSTGYYIPVGAAIDPFTGIFSFSKDSIGRYAFSFTVREWRKGTDGFDTFYNIGFTQVDFVMDITTPVGIKENRLTDSDLKVFPNPVIDKLKVRFDLDAQNNSQLVILNSLGETVFVSQRSKNSEEIDLSNLASGIYFLSVQTKSGKRLFKFIKE